MKNPKVEQERIANRLRKAGASAANTKGKKKPTLPPVNIPLPGRPACANGIDFSSWSGKVDFAAIRDNPGIEFFFFRASIGYTRDPRFADNLYGAYTTGKPFGVYHFWYPQRDTKRQVDLICALAKDTPLPYWFDAETNQGMSKQYCGNEAEKFLKYSEDKYGLRPDIYTNLGFWNSCMPLTAWAKHYNLAVACWSLTAVLPSIPQDWLLKNIPVNQQRRDRWLYWQWHNSGRVNGINAAVDLIRAPRDRFAKLVQS